MEQQELVIAHLKEKYNPLAIILHGSRARGMDRPNSDWDFYVFVNTDSTAKDGSESHNYQGHNLDVVIVRIPLERYGNMDMFGLGVRTAKILFDTEGVGATFLEKASAKYNSGNTLTEEDVSNRINRGRRLLDRIEGTIDNPLLQFYHLGTFYACILRYWYEQRSEWQEPPYVALKEIQEQDPHFYALLKEIVTNPDPAQKAKVCTEAYAALFPNN